MCFKPFTKGWRHVREISWDDLSQIIDIILNCYLCLFTLRIFSSICAAHASEPCSW